MLRLYLSAVALVTTNPLVSMAEEKSSTLRFCGVSNAWSACCVVAGSDVAFDDTPALPAWNASYEAMYSPIRSI